MTGTEREGLLRRLDQIGGCVGGSSVRIGQTYAAGTYPTTAAAWYAMADLTVGGSEAEGAAASFTSAGAFRAFNLGTAIPPVGSRFVCHAIEGRYVFRA